MRFEWNRELLTTILKRSMSAQESLNKNKEEEILDIYKHLVTEYEKKEYEVYVE